MRKLKLKINVSFILLSILLSVAGVIAIYELRILDRSFNTLILDNYKTVESLSQLMRAIELEDSGILLIMSGDYDEGKKMIRSGNSLFNSSYTLARKGIKTTEETDKLNEIALLHGDLRKIWDKPYLDAEIMNNMEWYRIEMHSRFLVIKQKVHEITEMHQEFLYKEASLIKANSRRAIMPGIVSIFASLLFAFILNFYINHYFVVPITRINQELKSFKTGQSIMDIEAGQNKELQELIQSINDLIRRLIRKQNPLK